MNWQMVGVLVAMLGVFSAVVLLAVRTMLNTNQAAVKVLLTANQDHADEKFLLLNRGIEKNNTEWQRIEKDFLRFQARLPERYVARDDWIRFSNLIDAKQDRITAKMITVNGTLQQLLERTKS